MDVKNKFIGSGMVFPITLNADGRPNIVNDLTLIQSSIKVILNWSIRTRFFNELFGSRIDELLEEPDDSISHSLLKFFIQESIGRWEKRVIITNIELHNREASRIDARLFYNIRNTKIEETMVFPFYKNIKY